VADDLDPAAVLWESIDDRGIRGRLYREDCDYLAGVLAAAGLLVTPEHDAQVAAGAWDEGHRVGWEHCQDGNYGTDAWDDDAPNPYNRIERQEGGR